LCQNEIDGLFRALIQAELDKLLWADLLILNFPIF
jgi:putative NADPH-quinone reductase